MAKPVSDRPLLPNVALAFVIAPLAGSVVAGLLATALAAPYRFGLGPFRHRLGFETVSGRLSGTIAIGMIAALAALCLAAVYTVIMGAIAVARHRRSGRAPTLRAVLFYGLLTGVFPFACFPVLLGVPTEFTGYDGPGAGWAVVFFLSIAATTSFITAWTFWRLGFKSRTFGGVSDRTE